MGRRDEKIDEKIKEVLKSLKNIDFKQRDSNSFLVKVTHAFIPKGGFSLDFGSGNCNFKVNIQ